MRDILSNMVGYEGVESASLVSLDGVLVLTVASDDTHSTPTHLSDHDVQPIQTMAALVSGWVGQIMRAVGQLSWNGPYRYVLKASEKNLVVHAFDSSFLLLVIEPEIDPEMTRALMDQAVQQFMGHMQVGGNEGHTPSSHSAAPYPQGLFPTQNPPTTGALAPDGSITESAGEG
jgi:predicted regulator of Ras-like GTPase activity (Roadblock/LC7/MglB family)